jgi:hypothetical protein
MARVIRLTILLLAAMFTAVGALAAQDAVKTAELAVNEYMLRGQFITTCHPPQSEAEIAAEERADDALGDATFNRLLAHFDAIDPTQHRANAEKADNTMAQLLADAGRRAEELLWEKGCEGLEDELKAWAR